MNARWLDLMGLARRAGRLLAGTEAVMEAMRRGRITLVLAAEDLSGKTKERLARMAAARGVRLVIAARKDELSSATGYDGRGVYGLTDANLAKEIAMALTVAAKGGVDHSG